MDDARNERSQLTSINPRRPDEVAAAARAVQANVASLRVAWSRLSGERPEKIEIGTPSPGTVREHREILIDRQVVKSYSLAEVVLRLRQVWGEFAALCWMFGHDDPHHPLDFGSAARERPMRCPRHVQEKLDAVRLELWRLRHEGRVRHDPAARREPGFRAEHDYALSHPVKVYGQDVRLCSDEDLLACACEVAGALAALRWVLDDRLEWEGPGIMEVQPPAGAVLPVVPR